MKHLLDVNVLIAASIVEHPHHMAATEWIVSIETPDQVLFCRETEKSLLRLLTQLKTSTSDALSNTEAIEVYRQWREQPGVAFQAESKAIDEIWPVLAENSFPSPKQWMDAYLAAFAISGGYQLVSFDKGFNQFESLGLKLKLLSAN